MEKTLPSLTRNLPTSQRYRFCRSNNSNTAPLDKSAAYTYSHLRPNNQNQSSFNVHASSFAFCQVQELCLQNNKWIIFD